MMEIKCTVPRFGMQENVLQSTTQTVTLSLDEKETNCSIKDIELYKTKEEVLSADFDIPYEYDSENKMLIISAPDYVGEKSFQAAFTKNGEPVKVEELERSDALKQWSVAYKEALYGQIVEHARNNKMAILTRKNWDEQLVENVWVHYKEGVFCGLSSEEKREEDGVRCVPLKSVEGGRLVVAKGISFWNVEGSSVDTIPEYKKTFDLKPPRESWIGLLDQCVFGYFKVTPQLQCICECGEKQCKKTNLVGGHVVFDQNYVRPRKSEAEKPSHVVGLLPICRSHNVPTNKKEMKTAGVGYGIWLNGYEGQVFSERKKKEEM